MFTTGVLVPNLPVSITSLIPVEKEQEERWAEHFEEVLNKEAPEEPAVAHDAEEDLDISIEPPTKEEIVETIEILRMVKHLGRTSLMLSTLNVIQSLQQRYYTHSLLRCGIVRVYQVTGTKGSSYQFLRKAHCLTVIIGGVSLFYPYLVKSSLRLL